MTDTLRVYSALITLFADNTTQQVGAQDWRDFIASSVGFMYGREIIATDTLDTDDIIVSGTSGAGGITVNLPAVATCQYKFYFVSKADAGVGALTLDPDGAETINGAASLALSSQGDFAFVWNTGTAWLAWGVY